MNINATTIMDIIKVMIAIVAIGWGAYEYYGKQEQNRIDRAQMYSRDYMNLTDVKTAVDNFWLAKMNEREVIFEWSPEEKKYKQSTYDGIGRLIAQAENEKIRNYVHQLAQFYFNVAVCLKDDLCDRQATCDSFLGDVGQYRLIHIDYLTKYSNQWMIDKHTGMGELLEACESLQAVRNENRSKSKDATRQ